MFTVTISLKIVMIIISSLSIYITSNLWILNYINRRLMRKAKPGTTLYINFNENKLRYMFLSVFVFFKYKEIEKEAIYKYNVERLKMLTELKYIYNTEEYDLERSELTKDIHKYQTYIKLKTLDKVNV